MKWGILALHAISIAISYNIGSIYIVYLFLRAGIEKAPFQGRSLGQALHAILLPHQVDRPEGALAKNSDWMKIRRAPMPGRRMKRAAWTQRILIENM